jgi:hypothetical protein
MQSFSDPPFHFNRNIRKHLDEILAHLVEVRERSVSIIPIGPFCRPGARPTIDGKRGFRRRPQLTKRELRIFCAAGLRGVQLSHESGQQVFLIDGRYLIPAGIADRLVSRGYLLPNDDGLCPTALKALTPTRT